MHLACCSADTKQVFSRSFALPCPSKIDLYLGKVTHLSQLAWKCPAFKRESPQSWAHGSRWSPYIWAVLWPCANPGLRRPPPPGHMVTKFPGSRCRKGACSAKAHRTHCLRVKFCMRINPKSLGSFSAGLLVKVSCFPVQMSNSDFCIEERQYLCCGFLFCYS